MFDEVNFPVNFINNDKPDDIVGSALEESVLSIKVSAIKGEKK